MYLKIKLFELYVEIEILVIKFLCFGNYFIKFDSEVIYVVLFV